MSNATFSPPQRFSTRDRNRRLVHDVTVDVAIVGGGITGVTAAHLLKQAGLTVAVLESRLLGEGETARTSAHLTEVADMQLERLLGRLGEDRARLAVSGQRHAMECVKALVNELNIYCQLQTVPAYLFAETDEDEPLVEREAMAARRLRLGVKLVDEIPLPFPIARALRVEDQAQLHPLAYLLGLARGIDGQGSYVFEHTHVLDIDEGGPCRVTTEMGTVSARHIVLATNLPVSTKLDVHDKVTSYRTHALGLAMPLPDPIGLLWDTGEPRHFMRSHSDDGNTYLVIGSEAPQMGDRRPPLRMLEDYVALHFGHEVSPADLRWSGTCVESLDGLPLVGPTSSSERVFIATGYGGNGVTYGTLAAMILADEIQGRPANPWRELFDPRRFSAPSADDFRLASKHKYTA